MPELTNRTIAIIAANVTWLERRFGTDDEAGAMMNLQEDGTATFSTPMMDLELDALCEYELTPAPCWNDQETSRINREELQASEEPFPLLDEEAFVRANPEASEHFWEPEHVTRCLRMYVDAKTVVCPFPAFFAKVHGE